MSADDEESWSSDFGRAARTVINNHFHSNVEMNSPNLGTDGPGGRATGRYSYTQLGKSIKQFVSPEGMEKARSILQEHSIVCLTGPPRTGKKTSGLRLLHDPARSDGITILSPALSLKELATTKFQNGRSYAVFGKQWGIDGDQASNRHALDAIKTKLVSATSKLVITSTHVPIDSVLYDYAVHIHEPDRVQLFKLAMTNSGLQIPEGLINAIDQMDGPAEVVAAARALSAGLPETDILSGLIRRQWDEVDGWFTSDPRPDLEAVAMVAALAFCPTMAESSFEDLLDKLTADLANSVMEGKTAAIKKDVALHQGRRKAVEGHPLVMVQRGETVGRGGPVYERFLEFRKSTYGPLAIEILWDSFRKDVWGPLGAWLSDIARMRSPWLRVQVAKGVANLYETAGGYVEENFILEWASGTRMQQETAAFVLQWIAFEGRSDTNALTLAWQLSTSGDDRRRCTAVLAFSGPLGARFPADGVQAISKIWLRGKGASSVLAVHALRDLFLLEIKDSNSRLIIVRFLLREITSTREESRRDSERRTLELANMLLASTLDDGQLALAAVATHTSTSPTLLAKLLSELLTHRASRPECMDTLWKGIERLGRQGATQAVSALGAQIRQDVGVDEFQLLSDEMQYHYGQTGSSIEQNSLVTTLMDLWFGR